jgi:hypothetical protein
VKKEKGLIKPLNWLRGRDLNPGPQGYEPCELPDCSTPRHELEVIFYRACCAESR